MNVNQLITKLIEQSTKILHFLKRYQTIIFIVFIALIYGFLIFRINMLSNQQPSSEISAKLERASNPHIDESVVNKIRQLQDNSVQVKSLFDQTRNNPFSECLDKNGQPTKPPNCV